MKRKLIRSTAFVRAVRKDPQLASQLSLTLDDYDLRIVFRQIEHDGEEAILLLTLGTHDEVY